MAKRAPKSAQQPELPKDRCPNCGGLLKFPEDWKEGLCPACGIFVEILPSTTESSPEKESVVREIASRRQTAKFYLESEELLADESEKEAPLPGNEAPETTPASKPDTASPVPTPAAPVQPKALKPGVGQPLALDAPPAEIAPAREAPPSPESQPLVEPAPVLIPTPPPPPPELAPEPPPPLSPLPESSSEPPLEPPPPPEAPAPESELGEIPEPEPTEEAPVPIDAEALVEPEPEVTEEPEVPFEPSVQPEATLEQDESTFGVVEPESAAVASAAAPVARAGSTAAARRGPMQPRLRDRVLLYVGSALVAFGGSGLVLGSILHDMFRVPLFGHAYDAFGPVNMSALMFGGLFLLAGLAAIGLSLRGGVVKVQKAVRA